MERGELRVGKGQGAMGKGQRAKGKGQWAMGKGQRAMGNGQWAMGDGQRAMGDNDGRFCEFGIFRVGVGGGFDEIYLQPHELDGRCVQHKK